MLTFKIVQIIRNRLQKMKDTDNFGLIHNITGNVNDMGGGHEFKFTAPDGRRYLVQVKRYS